MVVDMTIDDAGTVVASDIYRALVRNKAQLTYNAIAAWLDGTGPAPAALRAGRRARRAGPAPGRHRRPPARSPRPTKERSSSPAPSCGRWSRATASRSCARKRRIAAKSIIENFMVAANGVAVRFLTDRGFASIRRVVKSPERWSRIVDLASQHGGSLPGRAGRARVAAVPQGAARGRAGHVPGPVARHHQAARPRRVRRRERGGAERPLRARDRDLFALDGAEPALPRSRHPAAAEGGDRQAADAVSAARSCGGSPSTAPSRRTRRTRSSG